MRFRISRIIRRDVMISDDPEKRRTAWFQSFLKTVPLVFNKCLALIFNAETFYKISYAHHKIRPKQIDLFHGFLKNSGLRTPGTVSNNGKVEIFTVFTTAEIQVSPGFGFCFYIMCKIALLIHF